MVLRFGTNYTVYTFPHYDQKGLKVWEHIIHDSASLSEVCDSYQ